MKNSENIKDMVREKYSEIALQSTTENKASCCGAGGCSEEVYNIMTDSYEGTKGYAEIADLGLGCGLPTEFAKLREGATVLDLGSGAGNDCFVARAFVGEKGKVIGVDFTEKMIELARENAEKLGFNNVDFRQGDIEALPVGANRVDIVISNCVLNLVPNKQKAFSEIYRVLKEDGHFSISDVVLTGALPASLQNDAIMYAGCVAGAIHENEYLQIIKDAGFKNISIQKKKPIVIPKDILEKHLTKEEQEQFGSDLGIFSITVYAEKEKEACCEPGCC